MKILLISEKNHLLNEVNKVYEEHIQSGYMKFFTPKDMDLETHYDAVIAEEAYLNIINIKSVPVIIIKGDQKALDSSSQLKEEQFSNFTFITLPIDWNKLYEIIVSLQYVHNNIDFSNNYRPKVIDFTGTKMDPGKVNFKDKTIPTEENLSHELSTKLYTEEDMKKIIHLMQNFGEEHQLNDKIIAQASIILDELVFAMQKFHDATITGNEPKMIMKLESKDNIFNLFLECRSQIPNFKQVISIARDYGNMVKSFERNQSYFLSVQWENDRN